MKRKATTLIFALLYLVIMIEILLTLYISFNLASVKVTSDIAAIGKYADYSFLTRFAVQAASMARTSVIGIFIEVLSGIVKSISLYQYLMMFVLVCIYAVSQHADNLVKLKRVLLYGLISLFAVLTAALALLSVVYSTDVDKIILIVRMIGYAMMALQMFYFGYFVVQMRNLSVESKAK